MRVELRDGQWVELRERISHGQDKAIRRARIRTRENLAEEAAEDITVLLRTFIRDWHMNDVDGDPIVLADTDAIDRMPDDLADELVGRVMPLYVGATELEETDPKRTYARLIGRLALGQQVTTAEVDRLPDPDLFRDALFLTNVGQWSPRDLDETDALLLSLIRKFQNVRRG